MNAFRIVTRGDPSDSTEGTRRRHPHLNLHMRLQDDEDGQENEPMLSPSTRSPVHGTIEIEDGSVRFPDSRSTRAKTPGSNSTVIRWAKQRFSMVYVVLAILTLIALAVLVVALFLVVRVKRMDDKYHDVAENGKNEFRKLYEQVTMFRNGKHGTFREQDVKSIMEQLTPEQLAQAKAAGLIPNNANEFSPGIVGLEPIKPVESFNQADDPSTTIPTGFVRTESHWSGRNCNQQCQKKDVTIPPLVVISLDGFAREYLDRQLVPSLNRLSNCGARAEFIYPSYPSKTFPNHYTIATGLYPESHGIVDNGDLLRLPHEVPNNGTLGLLKPLLNNFNVIYPPKSIFLHVVTPCIQVMLFQKREIKSCTDDSVCNKKIQIANDILDACHFSKIPTNFFHTEEQNYCLIDLCGVSLVTTALKKDETRAIAIYESLTDSEAEVILQNKEIELDECYSIDARYDTCLNFTKEKERNGLKIGSILASSLSELNDLGRVHFMFNNEFKKGPFAYLQNITHQYAKKYSRLVVVSGTIYDEDYNGIADPIVLTESPQKPTHFYRILMRCENNKWNLDGHRCENELDTKVLSFIIKNEAETNCLDPMEYLMMNTARVRDIELLTGIHFFEEPLWYSEITSLRIRTNISQELWQL